MRPPLEEFRSEALGNLIESRRLNVRLSQAGDNPAIRTSTYDAAGHHTAVGSPANSFEWTDSSHTWYDVSGRTEREAGTLTGDLHPGLDIWQSAHYYDGNGRLALFEKHTGDLQQASVANDVRAVSEQYRYDAFGRRVLVRTLHDAGCTAAGCESTIQRFVWDGDQLLYETRGQADSAAADWMVENDNPSGAGQYTAPNAYGVVGYIHVGGIDRPLEVLRRNTTASSLVALFPQTNWRGLYETGTKDDGSLVTNTINWPGANASAYLGASAPPSPYEWFGSLILEQADASGLMYRRNRYYNPQTGRFTQPDPIGVGGGLNAYGFAAGDPVNYSDPLGLCPLPPFPCPHIRPMQFMGAALNGLAQAASNERVQDGALFLAATFAPEATAVADGIELLQAARAVEEAEKPLVDFVVNSKGDAAAIPDGARGPHPPDRGTGMSYTGGSGGKGMNDRVTGVRIMDADKRQGRRVNYMNKEGQTVDPKTGQVISRGDPRGHIPFD